MNIKGDVCNSFSNKFNEKIYNLKYGNYSEIVFLCIGTDRITGDSFGPLVGNKLKKMFSDSSRYKNIMVIGTLSSPVSATNIEKEITNIYSFCKKPYIVAIDSALSKKENIGKVLISDGGMFIGRGLNKNIKPIGNISIKGVVAKDCKIPKMNFTMLQNTSLNLVMNLAEETANGIYEAIKYR